MLVVFGGGFVDVFRYSLSEGKKKTTFVLSAARASVSSHEAMSVVTLFTKEQEKKTCTTMPNVFCSFLPLSV